MTLTEERPVVRTPVGRSTTVPRIVVIGSLVIAVLLVGHALVPDVLGLGLLIDSGLPWLGLLVVALAGIAVAARRGRAMLAPLVPGLIWAIMFVPSMIPLAWTAPPASDATLSVVSQNVEAESGTGTESAKALAATGADVVAMQELDAGTRSEVDELLSQTYEYSYLVGTVGLWSKFPIENEQPLRLGLGWNRALAADIITPSGPVSIYVIHAASARPDDHGDRDTMLADLAEVLPRDENDRVIAVGDFNAASTDRSFAPIAAQLDEPNQNGGGLGFTWPTSPFPITRLDHILQRGMEVSSNRVFPAGDSDHLAIATSFNL